MIEGFLPIRQIPESCFQCNFRISTPAPFKLTFKCRAQYGQVRFITDSEKELRQMRPEWCPIQMMPKPKPDADLFDFFGGMAKGWNNCLEIMKNPK